MHSYAATKPQAQAAHPTPALAQVVSRRDPIKIAALSGRDLDRCNDLRDQVCGLLAAHHCMTARSVYADLADTSAPELCTAIFEGMLADGWSIKAMRARGLVAQGNRVQGGAA